ncbi:MAG TPA: hypothetical protein VMV34_01700 [Terriglobia bacterium]|nr:hypothetical protein [Terriglobia bacterium]
MPSFLKHRSWRHATTWLLAAMQVHLLLVLVLHHHAIPDISFESSALVGQAHRHPQPLEGQQTYCTACQILRHSAVRPALGSPTPECTMAATLIAVCRINKILSNQPIARTGRSPPRG